MRRTCRFINAQQANLYASVYYDPFNPDVFHLPPGVASYGPRYDPYLSLDTLAAFSPGASSVKPSPPLLTMPLWALRTFLERWILPLLPPLRLSSSSAAAATDRAARIPI